MTISTMTELLDHFDHQLEVARYGLDVTDPVNATIECLTCGTVLIEFDSDPPPDHVDWVQCDVCGRRELHDEPTDLMCGDCGCCKVHCQKLDGCEVTEWTPPDDPVSFDYAEAAGVDGTLRDR